LGYTMEFSRHRHFRKKHRQQPLRRADVKDLVHPEHTGSESSYLKSLVDSHAQVTVVLTTGEKLRGRIRYYDRHCLSIGLSAKGPRLFIRKSNVSYIAEE
jgi:sRNA-binding regulator protein Hfq